MSNFRDLEEKMDWQQNQSKPDLKTKLDRVRENIQREFACLVKLSNQPNPEQSGLFMLKEVWEELRSTGSAYLWLIPNAIGLPGEIRLLPSKGLIFAPASGEYLVRDAMHLTQQRIPEHEVIRIHLQGRSIPDVPQTRKRTRSCEM